MKTSHAESNPLALSLQSRLPHMLGKKTSRCHLASTGETLTVSTIFPGTRTNTSQFTVDLAGLKELPQLLLIDSTFSPRDLTPLQLLSMLKSLSTAKLEAAAMEETQLKSTNMLTTKVSQIHLASSTLPLTWTMSALLLTFAETAPGHHVKRTKLLKSASLAAELSSTSITTPLSTINSAELPE